MTAQQRAAWVLAIAFSVFANLLMLVSPLYMLQIYDRVLVSRSEPTLLALSGLVLFLFVIMGVLDHARSRIFARLGARLQRDLDHRVFEAAFRQQMLFPQDGEARLALRDLETLARFWASPLLQSLLDLPWTPIFLIGLFIFHPLLGGFALLAVGVLLGLALLNQITAARRGDEAQLASVRAERQADQLRSEAAVLSALGMTASAFARWQVQRGEALRLNLAVADHTGGFAVASRVTRLFLQSAILGLGAWLVLRGGLSPGGMIAASILLGRALQPIEGVIGQWTLLVQSHAARQRLIRLLSRVGPAPLPLALPRPRAVLTVQGLAVVPPGAERPVLRGVSLRLEPGQALGVIGNSGAGKSSLARALCGIWPPAAGEIRLDGARLDQYAPDVLGSYIGYLPQRVSLFDGTIAQNIARLALEPVADLVVAAARKAGVHELILSLPQGYDTLVSQNGSSLSGGQIQRLGLARAFYGAPVLMILDEPNSNLDHDGSIALNLATRQAKAAGCAVLIMAHRPQAIQECDLLLLLQDGQMRAFGPREQVLREAVKNAADIMRPATPLPAARSGQLGGT